MLQIHGKVEGKGRSKLDKIAKGRYHRFEFKNLKSYLKYLDSLGTNELFKHASEVGVIPIHNQDILKEKLARAFEDS